MKIGVVIFPGSNCDEDIFYALKDVMKQQVVKLWHKEKDLQGCDFIVLPGGFSYGDYLRSGAIARFSPVMESVVAHAEQGGFVMGICNGFQILTESGLLPGALLHNKSQKFVCKNAYIRPASRAAALTSQLNPEQVFKIPVAHGEGRYFASDKILKELEENDQILFKYCDEKGEWNEEGNFNGSIRNIAGICNKNRNVFGMMPHPERAVDTALGNTDGIALFESLLNEITQTV
jgi:phosphoribosylformylglycinamidine synthase I